MRANSPTPSRKVEFWSETLQEKGYEPLPDYAPPLAPQPDRYPLVLTCAKPTLFCQTQHRALPSLRRRASCGTSLGDGGLRHSAVGPRITVGCGRAQAASCHLSLLTSIA